MLAQQRSQHSPLRPSQLESPPPPTCSGEAAQGYPPAGHPPPPGKSPGGKQNAGQRGTASSTGLPAVLKRCSNATSKPKPDPFLDGGERPKYCKPLQKKGFFPPLGSSHPSEKVPLLPVFYETPTHQQSNCSRHVLRFYVSNKKQLHLHKTCFFSSRLSARGWSGVGG